MLSQLLKSLNLAELVSLRDVTAGCNCRMLQQRCCDSRYTITSQAHTHISVTQEGLYD